MSTVADAIQWRWPGAQVVLRGDAIERWDGPMARPTDPEIAQAVSDFTPPLARAQRFTATSRQQDILALCACAVRGRNVAAWNALSTPQKVTATLAEADVFAQIREFIETTL